MCVAIYSGGGARIPMRRDVKDIYLRLHCILEYFRFTVRPMQLNRCAVPAMVQTEENLWAAAHNLPAPSSTLLGEAMEQR